MQARRQRRLLLRKHLYFVAHHVDAPGRRRALSDTYRGSARHCHSLSGAYRSSEALSSKTASRYIDPSSARARHMMDVVLPVPGGPCTPTQLKEPDKSCVTGHCARGLTHREDEVGHVALLCNNRQALHGICVTYNVFDERRAVLLHLPHQQAASTPTCMWRERHCQPGPAHPGQVVGLAAGALACMRSA